MNDTFFATVNSLGGRRKNRDREREGSTGSSTARAPSSGPSTLGRRTLDPITLTPRDSPRGTRREPLASSPVDRRPSTGGAGFHVELPAMYTRPRLASTGSAASGISIASGEVLGRMDPEIDDARRSSRGREWSG